METTTTPERAQHLIFSYAHLIFYFTILLFYLFLNFVIALSARLTVPHYTVASLCRAFYDYSSNLMGLTLY